MSGSRPRATVELTFGFGRFVPNSDINAIREPYDRAASTRSGENGARHTRTPVRSKIVLAIADQQRSHRGLIGAGRRNVGPVDQDHVDCFRRLRNVEDRISQPVMLVTLLSNLTSTLRGRLTPCTILPSMVLRPLLVIMKETNEHSFLARMRAMDHRLGGSK
jgi:hypothetical protein